MSACDSDNLGLNDAELASLTGFTGRMAQALAHLRDAWSVADDFNADAIEAAIAVLFLKSHSCQRNRALFERVLTFGFDQGVAARFLALIAAKEQFIEEGKL